MEYDSSIQQETEAMLRKFVLILAAGGLLIGCAACNTVKGMGRDIESVGQAGDDAIHNK